jgi:N-acetyl-anhydromuramyl-L-alanine amidase AmpD
MFVLHWDVCRSSQACYQTLVERGLSIHLMVDGDAMVYQALDLRGAVGYHASSSDVEGPENLRSVGVEINNLVLPKYDPDSDRPMAKDQPKPNSGDRWNHLDYTDAQKERVVELCVAICDAMGIEKRIPRGANLVGRKEAVGVVGHYHLATRKIDPGLTLWPALEAAGFKVG